MEAFISWAINILITVYLVIDSKKHGKSPVLWGILGFFFGTIALGIYLIRTDRKLIGWIVLILSTIVIILVILFIVALIFFTFSL